MFVAKVSPLRHPRGMIFGYARVSTDGQSVGAQVKTLRAAGAKKIFRETASGAKTDRRELARALKVIGKGDVLLVTRLDRLARSTRDRLNKVTQADLAQRFNMSPSTISRFHVNGASY